MGLFSSLKHIVAAVAPAVGTALGGPVGGAIGGGVSSLLSGKANKNAIGGGNDALQLGLNNGINALNTQFGQTSANFNPFIMGGQQAFGQEGDILGLHGAGAQGSIIDQLKGSPLFQSLFRTGQDTILNNASATGGLRGGNTQSSLANFGSDTLAQVIQQQLQNLTGASQMGLSAAGQLGSFGAQNANSLADLLVGQGKANAGSLLNGQAVDNSTFGQIGKLFGGSGVTDQLSGLFSGLFGGGGSSGGGIKPIDPSSIVGPNVKLPSVSLPF